MFIILALVLGVAWLLGFAVFHAFGFAIHILLVAAAISLIFHFLKGGRTRIA